MTDHYADGTYRWWHLSGPSPELISALRDGWLPHCGRALDIGCGLGAEASHLAATGWQAIGIDLSAVALTRAAAIQPAAVDPAAVDPAAIQPAAVDPAAIQPAAVDPAAIQPVVAALKSAPAGQSAAAQSAAVEAPAGERSVAVEAPAAAGQSAAERPTARFLRADLRHLPLRPHSLDAALDRGCFHYLAPADRPRYAAELGRVLRPGGKFLLRASLHAAGVRNDIDESVIRHTFTGWRIDHIEAAAIPTDTRTLDVLVVRLTRPAAPAAGPDSTRP